MTNILSYNADGKCVKFTLMRTSSYFIESKTISSDVNFSRKNFTFEYVAIGFFLWDHGLGLEFIESGSPSLAKIHMHKIMEGRHEEKVAVDTLGAREFLLIEFLTQFCKIFRRFNLVIHRAFMESHRWFQVADFSHRA